jgi:hypothetical protein
MASIEGIDINSNSISKCYEMFYSETYNQIKNFNLFEYLHLWGIRLSTCDTSLPDDLVGGLRVNNFNFIETVASSASTDPSPYYINKPDLNPSKQGGVAFVMEGQYAFKYNGKNYKNWKPYPSFCPTKPVKVYRWKPSAQDIKLWKDKKKPLSSSFADAVKNKKVTISTSIDTCIHRAWSKKLYNDSAGCQILSDLSLLNKLGDWAVAHQKKKYGNLFVYTLFTKEQFLKANK